MSTTFSHDEQSVGWLMVLLLLQWLTSYRYIIYYSYIDMYVCIYIYDIICLLYHYILYYDISYYDIAIYILFFACMYIYIYISYLSDVLVNRLHRQLNQLAKHHLHGWHGKLPSGAKGHPARQCVRPFPIWKRPALFQARGFTHIWDHRYSEWLILE